MRRARRSSFLLSLTAAYLGILGLAAGLLLLYLRVRHVPGDPAGLARLFLTAAVIAASSFVAFRRVAVRFERRLRQMIDGMNGMLEGGRASLAGRIDNASEDELGQLGMAFNDMQDYVSGRYEAALRELRLSDRLQRRLLPEGRRTIAGCVIAAECRQTNAVGGDLYDIVALGEDRVAVLIGDVAGKGMQAALLMSGAMALFRREIRAGGSAADTLTRLNRLLYRALQGQTYVTAGLAIVDRRALNVDYASAGHMPPYLLRDGTVRELDVSSLPLGIAAGTVYRGLSVPFPAGTSLVLFTDGMIECAGADGRMLGFEGFERLLLTLAAEGADCLIEKLARRVEADAGAEGADDRTVVLVTREPGAFVNDL